jgi:light-regulated signal transduction histidine kinase (bacteriophytochrome)
VGDHGIGNQPRCLERIFVRFQRPHTRDEYPGTGMGLAICKKLVERHSGRLDVDRVPERGTSSPERGTSSPERGTSSPERGTSFRRTLPVVADEREDV